MEFVGKQCHLCGKKFGNRKPKDATEVNPFTFDDRRIVYVVAPCPFCEKPIPVWGGTDPIPMVREPEPPREPEPGTEPGALGLEPSEGPPEGELTGE